MATANAMFTITDVGDLNGRNLVLNSGAERSGTVPSSRDYVYVSSYSVSEFGKSFVHTQNQQLTVSCEYEVIGNTLGTAYIYWQLNGTQTSPDNRRYVLDSPTGDFQVTFKVTSTQASTTTDYIRIRLFHASTGSVISVKNVKLEIGDTATDWTPAPEDVSTALDDAKEAQSTADNARTAASNAQATADDALDEAVRKNSVYYQATAPTGNLKDGDTWFDTGNHYKISRWNVAEQNWIAAPLGDQAIGNLNASHINTGTLTAVDIEAGKAQDIAGTIKVYDENDSVKVSLDKDGLMATKGKIGGWNITSNSIEYDDGTAPTDSTVISTDPDTGEELIEEGQPGLVGGRTILKLCTYDSSYPDAGPQLISATYNSSNVAEDSTLRIGSGGLSCDYNRNNGVTGGSLSLSPKLINIINADYDEDQVLWTDSANLNPGSLTILMSKTENGEQTAMGRSFLTHGDLSFIGDPDNPQLASGIAHWSVLAARRTIKDELGVTIYHCGNLFWAHFDGKMTVGWAGRMEEYISIVPNDDASFTNSQLCAPPSMLEKYCLPQSPANPRAIYRVFTDGRLGLYHFIPPTNGDNNYEVLTYDNWEPCDIFWAHIG